MTKEKRIMNEKYPYLGINYIDEKPYVVLFTEEEYGVINY